MISQEFIYKYNIKYKVQSGYIFVHATNGLCGIPQADRIKNDSLVQHLETY